MLVLLTIVLMGIIAYAYFIEGLFTAFVMCCNVVGAGLVAFNFWEPLADQLDLGGYEDALCLVLLFCLTLGALRTATNHIARTEVEFAPQLQRPGGAFFGLVAGYLVSGFLVCVMQTLPWHENFMLYNPKYEQEKALAKVMPPDRVWLAMMHRAGEAGFSSWDGETFDPHASFIQRYARYRRYNDQREPLPYRGEFDPGRYGSPTPKSGS